MRVPPISDIKQFDELFDENSYDNRMLLTKPTFTLSADVRLRNGVLVSTLRHDVIDELLISILPSLLMVNSI